MTTVPTATVNPVSASERIASLDVIRGIAILFILCMNVPWMLGYSPAMRDPRIPTWTGLDESAFSFVFVFLNGTQRGLLELLFGAGIMIMARKAMSPDGPVSVADLHYRRNLLLIALGLFNALVLLWPGDILLPYGLVALFLFPARILKAKAQLVLAALIMAVGPISYEVDGYLDQARLQHSAAQAAETVKAGKPLTAELKKAQVDWNKATQQTKPLAENPQKKKRADEIHQARMGSLTTYAAAQYETWEELFRIPEIFWWLMGEVAATMLIGAALFQLGILQGKASTRTYAIMLVAGYAMGFGLRIWSLQSLLAFTPDAKLSMAFSDISRLAVTFGHLAAIHLLLRSRAGRTALTPFVAAGRMPLTTYLFTSLLMCWLLAPGIGVGLHGSMGWFGMQMLALSIIAAEVVMTNIWMRYHATGPMEWLWKSLAYGERQHYRRLAPASPAISPIG